MATMAPAALGAKRLLSSAAQSLQTADPVEQLAPFLDESLQLPPGALAYRTPHAFETSFSEKRPNTLAVGMTVGDPMAPPPEKVSGATRAMRYIVHHNFGSDALRWLDGRSEPARYRSAEGWLASGFDRNGVREAQVSYGWGPQTAESLASPIFDTVQAAMGSLPGLQPAFTSIKCGRSFGSQEVTFRMDGPLQLSDLRPLMDQLSLGNQHTRLVNAVAFVLGARFTLPPGSTLITLRPAAAGIEMRIDIDLESIPDVPPNVASLLQLQLVERPQSLAALERWVLAMTPQGFLSPGALSVLSVTVRPDQGPRLEINMRPSVVIGEGATADGNGNVSANAPSAVLVPQAASLAQSPWDPR